MAKKKKIKDSFDAIRNRASENCLTRSRSKLEPRGLPARSGNAPL